jgi:hypothetical protein
LPRRRAVVRRLKAQAGTQRDEEGARRRAIEGQLARAKDLYLLGDFTREQYEAHKRVLQAEISTLEPPMLADASEAAAAATSSLAKKAGVKSGSDGARTRDPAWRFDSGLLIYSWRGEASGTR